MTMMDHPEDAVPGVQASIQKQRQLYQMITADPSLSSSQKQQLVAALTNGNLLDQVMSGAAGGGLGYILAKFMNMSRHTQMIMSLAGFGIGSVLYDKLQAGKKGATFKEYNPKVQGYEINQN